MMYSVPTIRKHWLAFAAVVILLAAALAAGTLFAASERSRPELLPLSAQSITDATDLGFVADLPAPPAQRPQDEPGAGADQVAPDPPLFHALQEWLDNQPDVLGPYTVEDTMAASYRDVDWMLYEMVHAAALLPAALAFDLMGGGAVLGHAAGHAHAPAMAAEELPVGQPRGSGNDLHPPGDLGLRKPEHFRTASHTDRPDVVQSCHGGGGHGHHGALGLHVGLGADHAEAGKTVVVAMHVEHSVRRLMQPLFVYTIRIADEHQ